MSSSGETPPPEQPAEARRFEDLLSGFGNHEGKLAVNALLAWQSGQSFRTTELFTEILDRQGDVIGWRPETSGPAGWCRHSLIPAGTVVQQRVKYGKRGATVYGANTKEPAVVAQGFALSGALMKWSLDYTDTSVQILGQTGKKGGYRTPELRYGILQVLAAQETDEPLANPEITTMLNDPRFRKTDVIKNVSDLGRAGVLEVATFDAAQDATLEIISPDYWHRHIAFEELKPETQLVYRTIRTLWDNGKREITFQDFIETATALDPAVSIPSLRRHYWAEKTGDHQTLLPGLRVASRTIESQKRSGAAIKPMFRQAFVDLVGHVEAVRSDPASWAGYQKTAKAILKDPPSMSALFAKAKEFSSQATIHLEPAEAMGDHITTILQQHGALNAAEIQAKLTEQGAREVTPTSIRAYLRGLADKGVVAVEKRRPDPTRDNKRNYYALSEEASKSTPEG